MYTYNVALTVPAPFVITTSLYISVKFDNLNQIPAPATLISAVFPFTVIVPKSASANDTYNPNVSSAGWILTISLIAPSLIALYVSLYVASDELIKSSADQSFSAATGTVGTTGAGVVVSTVPGSTTGVVVSSTVASPNTPSSYTEIPYASAFGLHPVATTFTYWASTSSNFVSTTKFLLASNPETDATGVSPYTSSAPATKIS